MSMHRLSIAGLLHALLAGCALAASPAEKPSPPPILNSAAGEESLWIVAGRREDGNRLPSDDAVLNDFAMMARDTANVRPAGILSQRGTIARMAVAGTGLHVFYTDGAHYRYARQMDRREIRLPGSRIVPEAVAGQADAAVPVLWAVVSDRTGQDIVADWEEYLRTLDTQPADASLAPREQPSIGNRAANGYQLVSYRGERWQPGFAVLNDCAGSHRIWLAVHRDEHHLFWQKAAEDAQINYAVYQNGRWRTGPTLPLSRPPEHAFAAIANNQLKFSALVQAPGAHAVEAESWVRAVAADMSSEWNRVPPPRDAAGTPIRVPPGAAICTFGDNLVLVRHANGETQVGFWRLMTGEPDQPFRAVQFRSVATEQGARRGLREFTATLVVAVLLVLVFWRRQESLANPVMLPADMSITRPGKRALAALIDVLPAAVIVGVIWKDPILSFYHEVKVLGPDAGPDVVWPRELLIAWLTFSAIYAVYCMVFELVMARTPGKMLLGCIVLSETLARPTPVQIVVRNLSRIVEIEPHLQIWPFMLVIFLTRNRQRIGDLLARTIVVDGSRIRASREAADEEA